MICGHRWRRLPSRRRVCSTGDGDQSWAAKREVLETVVDESHRLAHQVDNLLDMARLNAGKVDLDRDWQVVEEMVGVSLRRMRHELKDRSVVARIPGDLPLVWASSELIEQVFVNLLENATHYTPLGSPIEISATRCGERVEVRVADHGPGIPAGRESQIFDLFAGARMSLPTDSGASVWGSRFVGALSAPTAARSRRQIGRMEAPSF